MTLRALLVTWVSRGRPPRRLIAKAVLRSTVASAATNGLFIAAVALLVLSSHHPSLRSIAILLVVIELVAFLRSPLRFLDRLSSHQLGFTAVQEWRRTVAFWITNWDDKQASQMSHGQVLDRALRDTEELQNLWLRTLLPGLNAVILLVLATIVIALLPSATLSTTLLFVLLNFAGAVVISLGASRLRLSEIQLRDARSRFREIATDSSKVAATLSLLKSKKVIEDRLGSASAFLRVSERRYASASNAQRLALFLASFGSLCLVASAHFTRPLWQVVGVLVALSTFDFLLQWQQAIASAVALTTAIERLDLLEPSHEPSSAPFPFGAQLGIHGYLVGDQTIDLLIPLGSRLVVTGPSGSGKSTLLKVLSGMSDPATGFVTVGGVPIRSINPYDLREFITYVPTESQYVAGYVGDITELGRDVTRDYVADFKGIGLDWESSTELINPSRGERSRLAVVRALATSPAILVLDEPTSGLGELETKKFLALLDNIEATIVIASHDPLVVAWAERNLRLS